MRKMSSESTENQSESPVVEPEPVQTNMPEPIANPQAEKASREAAKYRSKAKALETQLEAATTLLNAARASIVESLNKTSGHMLIPEALRDVLADTDVSQFFTDDGAVDSKSFDTWAKSIVAERPYLSANKPPILPDQADVPKYEPHIGDAFGNAIMGAR
jgi:hypothetical protein